jgi:aryl carrier-like protein
MTGELVPQLREYLKESLPEYMTPSHFILLDSLPLTANGKLDRGALPLYEPSRAAAALEKQNEFVEPTTGTEKMLVESWKELLLLDKVSIHDNFFQLGGDSINAIQLISRMNKKGFNLSVSHLYRNMTVAEFGRYIDNHWEEVTVRGQAGIPALELKIDRETVLSRLPAGVEIEDIYPLTPLQKHMLAYYLRDKQENGDTGLYVNQVRLRWPLDISHIPLLKQAFRHLSEVYPYLRTAFMWENIGEPLQVVHKHAPVDIQCYDWSHLPPGERDRCVEDFIARDHYRGFERDNPAVERLAIIALSPSESLIIKTSDLMRVDGWSAMIITTKLFEYMRGLSAGQAQKLEPNDSYRDYLFWLSSRDQVKGKDFWQAMLRGCPVPTPIVECAPRNRDTDGGKAEPGFYNRTIYLGGPQTNEVNNFLKQNQIVLSALTCGIWALLLGHYTGHDSVIFGVLFSGRGAALAGVESMIGQAVNILPMRIDLSREAPMLTWIRRIWDTLAALHPYETDQQDNIRQWWNRPTGQPLFESYLVVENFPGIKEKSKIDASGRPNFEYIAQMEYPLRVEFQPGPELGLVMQYYRRHFTAESIEAMMNDLQTLLAEIIKNPAQKVGDLEGLISSMSWGGVQGLKRKRS